MDSCEYSRFHKHNFRISSYFDDIGIFYASIMFIIFSAMLTVCVFLLINFATLHIVDFTQIEHLHAPLWMTALTAAVTTAPFAVYCMRLVRRLRNTKRDLNQAGEITKAVNAAKSAFIANRSHETRTPLNGGWAWPMHYRSVLFLPIKLTTWKQCSNPEKC